MKKLIYTTLMLMAVAATPTSLLAQKVSPKEYAFNNYEQYLNEAQQVSDKAKEADIEAFRKRFQKQGYRKSKYIKSKEDYIEPMRLMANDGSFPDLDAVFHEAFPNGLGKVENTDGDIPKNYISDAWDRIAKIADGVVNGKLTLEQAFSVKLQKSILYYGDIELRRINNSSRFHESCFAVPTAAMNTYYAFLDRMDQIEAGAEATQMEQDACKMLKVVALQAWTQPLRGDKTDLDVSSIERFQKHVWWVGGNGVAYRSLLPVACMYKSIPMLDVLSEVAKRGIDKTSQVTYDTAFWTEGFTADGAGWGHGMQCLIWGYPIDGTSNALNLLSYFSGTEWGKELEQYNKDAIINYLRGSNWFYYKGYTLPCLGRGSFGYVSKPEECKAGLLTKNINKTWRSSFSDEELREIDDLVEAYKTPESNITMKGYQAGLYNGIRWFFNNDNLIRKNDDFHVIVSMASSRVDGIESAHNMADRYNFTTCDGMTLFQRQGNEYMKIYGAFDVLRAPGVTARQGMDKLIPVTNWRGYCSKHNFAGGATLGSKYGVAGYKFEKMNASAKAGTNDTAGLAEKNEILYGVQAHKAYFFLGNYMLALGAGVSNVTPEVEGDIHTSIEQTSAQNEIYLLKGGEKSPIGEGVGTFKSTSKSLEWLVQKDKFAYTVLPKYAAASHYVVEHRMMDWAKMNFSNGKRKDTPVEDDVLQVWTDHGAKPMDETYGYLVYLGKDNDPSSKMPVAVLSNTVDIQAAATLSLDIVQAVFYTPEAMLKYNRKKNSIAVSEPCVVVVDRGDKNKLTISISDPQMRTDLTSITVTVDGKGYEMELPSGEMTSSVVTKEFKL